MKVAITGTVGEEKLPLEKALNARGHTLFSLRDHQFEVGRLYDDPIFDDIDLVYFWGCMGSVGKACLAEDLLKKGVPFVNKSVLDDPLLDGKIYQLYLLSKKEIKFPTTVIKSTATHSDLVETLGLPYVAKVSRGYGGKDVALIESKDDLRTFQKENLDRELLYQEFIEYDADYRVHVVDGKAICAYERVSSSDDFRANISLGGSMEKIDCTKTLSEIYTFAEEISKIFPTIGMPGIDILRRKSDGQLYFLEINRTPGLGDVEKITGENISEPIVDYLEKVVREEKENTKN